jgi:hypothetical protein
MVLTPGQTHDVKGFAPLFRMITDKIEAFLGDRGDDDDAIREGFAIAEVEAVIPAKSNRKSATPHDRAGKPGSLHSRGSRGRPVGFRQVTRR